MPTPSNLELVLADLVAQIDAAFVAAFGAGRHCSRGIPIPGQLPEETPWAWLQQGPRVLEPVMDNGFPLGTVDVLLAVRVLPTQSDQDAADLYGQSAVWMKVNEAIWILDQFLVPPNRSVGGFSVTIKPKNNGEAVPYWGDAEAWIGVAWCVTYPTGMPDSW